MIPDDSRDRIAILAYGVLVLFAPVMILVLTLGFLSLTGDLVLGRVTPLEFLELYVIELVLVVGFGYGLYRLTLWVVRHRLPAELDALEARDAVEEGSDDANAEEVDR